MEDYKLFKKPVSSLRRTLAGGLLLTVLANAFLYIGHVVIARRLSREEYAIFTVVVSFISLMALFADLGLTLLFVRKFAEADERSRAGDDERRGQLLGSMLVLRVGLAILVSAAVFVIAPLLGYPNETQKLMHIMLLTLFISSRLMVVRSVGEAFVRGHNKYHFIALFTLIDAAVFASALFFYGGGKTLDLEGAVWIYSLCHIPGFLLLIWLIGSSAKEIGFRLSIHFGMLWDMVREGLPLIFSTAFLTIHNFADALLLDKLSTPQQVSAYGAGIRILTAVIFLPTVFSAVIGPQVTQAIVRGNSEHIRTIVDRALRLLLVTALIIGLSLTCASNTIIGLLFGSDKYGDAVPIVIMFGWTFFPIVFATFLSEIAIAEGKLWISTLYMCVIMFVSVTMDFILIPSLGAFGAAASKCIAVTIGSVVLLIASRQMHVIEARRFLIFLLKCCLALGVALLAYFGIRSSVELNEILIVVAVLVVFLGVVMASRAIGWTEVSNFFQRRTINDQGIG